MSTDDANAFYDRFVAPLENRMVRTIWRIVRDTEQARDAMQDALTVIWARRDVVSSHPNPEALVLRMCMNAAYDALRRICRLRTREVAADGAPEVPGPPLHPFAEEPITGHLRAAIDRLPQKQAVAFLMRVLAEESYAAIAQALGCSQVTARIHVMRARSQMRRWLAPGATQGRRKE